MSEKTDELIFEATTAAMGVASAYEWEWGGGVARYERELSEAKQALRAEIAAMEKVVQAAVELVNSPSWNREKLYLAVKEYQERHDDRP